MSFISKNEKNTISFARKYAKDLKKGSIIFLIGELGSGKTQFVKGLAEGLDIEEPVSSPTFVYENVYRGRDINLYHFDLYREEKLDEDIKMMILEAAKDPNGITVIEWADRIKEDLDIETLVINFNWLSENEREIVIKN